MCESGCGQNSSYSGSWEIIGADPRGVMYLYRDGTLSERPVTPDGAQQILESLARGAALSARPL